MGIGKVAKNTMYLLSGSVGQKILAFVYFAIVARRLGVVGTGQYFTALSFTIIFSIFVDLGLANVLIREVARFPEKAEKLLATVLGIKVVLAVLTVIAVLIAAMILRYPSLILTLIAMASVVMVLDATHLVFYATMRGFQNLRYEAIGVLSGQIITIVAGTFFLLLRMPVPYLVVALLCGSVWNVVWSGTMLYRAFGVRPRFSYDSALVRFFIRVTIPFALAGIFSRIYSYIDTVMLSKMVGDAAVGIYSAAYKITFAFQFLPMAFAAAMYPAMSDYAAHQSTKLAELYATVQKYLLLIVLPLTTGIFLLAGQIIVLMYGTSYRSAIPALQVIIFSLIFAFLYWPSGSLLNASDRQKQNTVVMGVTMCANIIANIVLIPRFGPVGAAISALIGNFLLWFGAMMAARSVVNTAHTDLALTTVKIGVACGVMGGMLYVLRGRVPVLLLVPLAMLVYGGGIVGTKAIAKNELQEIFGLLKKKNTLTVTE